ncbi:MAG TPA: IclR family transcriptional regulator [Egibacteraceae bacterium]|nr:IclR family transcriptional regulator [Egibacteraceae bacterium]
MTVDSAPRNNSSSLRRALAILAYIADDGSRPHGLTLAELAEGVAISKSTLLRLLGPLCDSRLVEKDAASGRYRLGAQTARLGQTYLERIDAREIAHDVLIDLMESSGESVHLVVFDSPDVVYVDKVESRHPVRMYSRVGSRQPAYCTAVGKAFLMHADEDVLGAVIDAGLERRTANTITTEEWLRSTLAEGRERGFAVDDVENEPEIRCIGAPIFDHLGAVSYAISVSGPAHRVTPERVDELGEQVKAAAAEISRRLGAPSGA